MDTFSAKTRAALSFDDWRELSPERAAREVQRRVEALPGAVRTAALAWLAPEARLRAELAGAPAGPLRGLPYFLKDLFDLAGTPTRAGSAFLADVRPEPHADCTMVRWLRAQGAAPAGKAHLVEFASGLTGENIHYGDCPHPRHPDRLTGGSSSGSAALVAAGVVPLAVGTDTGGSVRVPASFCGLYGLRLTPGDAFIRDAFPLSATCDTAGWLTATAADMRALLGCVTGQSPRPLDRPLRGCHLRLADLITGFDPDTAAACDRAASALCPAADDTTQQQLLADWREARPTYSTISMREAFEIHRPWMDSQRDRYDPVIRGRYAEAGTWPAEKIAAAHRTREDICRSWRQFFSTHDFVVLPAVPSGAPRKEDCTMDFRLRILTLTAPASVGGLPVLTIPVPLPSGLTAGLQVVARDTANGVFAAMLDR